MGLLLEKIEVQVDARGWPQRLVWRRRIYFVGAVHERWLYAGKWWATPRLRGRARTYYRIEAVPVNGSSCAMEVFEENGGWKLSKLLD